MRKVLTILLCALLLAGLMGCGREDPYRVDTVVRIPVDPTQAPTEQEETELSETLETEPTELPAEETAAPGGGSSGSKNSSPGNRPSSGSKGTEPPATDPPATEVPATETPVTEPLATEAAATEPPETQETADPSAYSVGSLEYAILDELNAYREEAGLPALSMSTKLCGIAAVRAEEISRVWSHTRPDGRYCTTVLGDYGYGYSTAAENLVYVSGSGDAAAIVAKWMGADNKDSLLSESFTTAGIGVYRSGGVTYVANLLVG